MIRAGKLVFESDTQFRPAPAAQPAPSETTWPIAPDGTLPPFQPGFRYYIRKKGVVEVGVNSCAGCHTRVLPDGTLFEGGQGMPNPPQPVSETTIRAIRESTPEAFQARLDSIYVIIGLPGS